MPDREKTIKGLADISEYVRAKADIAGIGKGKEVFDSYYRAAEDAIALLKDQEAVKPTWSHDRPFCGACGLRIRGGKFCCECGKPILWGGR